MAGLLGLGFRLFWFPCLRGCETRKKPCVLVLNPCQGIATIMVLKLMPLLLVMTAT